MKMPITMLLNATTSDQEPDQIQSLATYECGTVQKWEGLGLLGVKSGGNTARRGRWGEGGGRAGEACGGEGSDLDHGYRGLFKGGTYDGVRKA